MNVMVVGLLAGPRDMFRCVPYGTTMRAGSCLLRQANARRAWKPGDSSDAKKSKCIDCALGREVSARLVSLATVLDSDTVGTTATASAVTTTPVVERDIKPQNTANTTASTTEKTMAKCTFEGCKDDAASFTKRCPPDMTTLCKVHRQRESWRRAERKGRTGAVTVPARTAPAPAPAANAKRVAPKTSKPALASQPSTLLIRMASVEIEGENVSLEQLAGLWSAVRKVLGA